MNEITVENVLNKYSNEYSGIRAVRLWLEDKTPTVVPGEVIATITNTNGEICFQWVDFDTGEDGYVFLENGELVLTSSDGALVLTGSDVREQLQGHLEKEEIQLSPLLKSDMPANGIHTF